MLPYKRLLKTFLLMWCNNNFFFKALDAADRTNILDDAFALAESGYLDYSIALSLTNFLKYEDHFVVWAHASANLLNIDTKLRNTSIYYDFRVIF